MTSALALSFFALQALAMGVDEFFFHRRRNLPPWERWGHPVDTLSLALCVGFTLVWAPSEGAHWVFAGMAVFSCLLVTKDEWVHARLCSPGEHWLHACLFLLHPACLYAVHSLWMTGQNTGLLQFLLIPMLGFAGYQVLAWNHPWRAPGPK